MNLKLTDINKHNFIYFNQYINRIFIPDRYQNVKHLSGDRVAVEAVILIFRVWYISEGAVSFNETGEIIMISATDQR